MQDEQLEIGADQVRGLFDAISAGYQPPATDLVPEAMTAARRATRRRALTYTAGAGALAAIGSLAFVLGNSSPARSSTASSAVAGSAPQAAAGAAGAGEGTVVYGTNTPAASTITKQCTGTYLPWSSGSDSSLYGKGSNAQRTTVCEQDLTALKTLLPGVTVTQSTQPYGPGVQSGEIMPDQVAEMGSGMKADTPVLNPWQYNVTAHGRTDILNIEYSRDTTGLGLCSPCTANTALAHGFRLVDVIAGSDAGSPHAGVQIRTPQGENIVIYISTLTQGGKQTVDPVSLAEQADFTAMLAADLAIIGDN